MIMAKFCNISFLVITCAVITANARKCYVCRNCPKVNSSLIQTCENRTITTVPSSPSTEDPTTVAQLPTTSSSTQPPTTSSSTEPPTTSSSTQPPTTSSSTEPPTTSSSTQPPTTSSSTEAPTTSSSTQPPTTSSSTEPPTTNSSTQPPTTSSSTQPPTTSSSTEAPTTSSSTQPPTTSSSTDAPTTSSSTQPPTTSSTTEPPTTSSSTEPPTTSSSTQPPTTSSSTETATSDTAENLINNRKRRSLLRDTSEPEPQCIEAAYEENGVINYIRDCYYAPDETEDTGDSTDICREIVGLNGTISKCNVCTKDLCNASVKATTTISLITSALIFTFNYFKQ